MNGLLDNFGRASDFIAIDWVVLTLLLVSAFMAIRMRDLLASVVILGIFSLLMALMYLLLDAPDVALTEAAVGAGIATVLFLGTLSFTEREHKVAPLKRRILPLIVVTTVGVVLVYATAELPAFASPDAPAHQHLAPYYIEHTKTDIGIPNMVTAVLASYRGFDTMGEVAVVFTAGIGITALLMNLPQQRPTPSPNQNPVAPPAATSTTKRKKNKKRGGS